eukprot:6882476-Lingulodinium_polyedra.AAC.1
MRSRCACNPGSRFARAPRSNANAGRICMRVRMRTAFAFACEPRWHAPRSHANAFALQNSRCGRIDG